MDITEEEIVILSQDLDRLRRSIDETALPACSRDTIIDRNFRKDYEFWSRKQLNAARIAYTISRRASVFAQELREVIRLYEPYIVLMQEIREVSGNWGPHDPAAIADEDFADPFCYAVACFPSSQAIELARRTDSGFYRGENRFVDTREAHLVRCLRSFLLGNDQQLREEIGSLDTLRGSGSTPDTPFGVPRRTWNAILESAFIEDDAEKLRSSLQKASQWYERLITKVPPESLPFRKAYGMPALLALATIGFRHRGYGHFELPDIMQPGLMCLE